MNIFGTQLFPYLQGVMLKRGPVTMTMKYVQMETIEGDGGRKDEKPVLYFIERDKGLILNKTNAKMVAELYGPETDEWNGQVIELYAEKVNAFGKTHDAVRVRKPAIVQVAEEVAQETAKLSKNGQKKRLQKNVNVLRDTDDDPIGEDVKTFDEFAGRVIMELGYTNKAEIEAQMGALGLEYHPDLEQTIYDDLAKERQAA